MEIQDGHQELIFDEKITFLHVDHHGGHKVGPIVFILGLNIAEIRNKKWPPRGFFQLISHCKNDTFAP